MPALRGRLGKGVGIAGPVEPRRGPTSGRQAARFGPALDLRPHRRAERRTIDPKARGGARPPPPRRAVRRRPARTRRPSGTPPAGVPAQRFADGSVKGSGSRARGTPTWADFWTPGGQNSAQPFDLRPHGRAERRTIDPKARGGPAAGAELHGPPAERRSANARTRRHASATLAAIPELDGQQPMPLDGYDLAVKTLGPCRHDSPLAELLYDRRSSHHWVDASDRVLHRRHRGDGPRARRGGRPAARASRPAARAARSSSTRRRRASGSSPAAGSAPA